MLRFVHTSSLLTSSCTSLFSWMSLKYGSRLGHPRLVFVESVVWVQDVRTASIELAGDELYNTE